MFSRATKPLAQSITSRRSPLVENNGRTAVMRPTSGRLRPSQVPLRSMSVPVASHGELTKQSHVEQVAASVVQPVGPSASSWPHIDRSAIQIERSPGNEAHNPARPADGSLEDLEDDQDAVTPAVFERRPRGRGVHIRVPGGSPAGTPDFPDGIRWIQTIDTNAPLFGQSPPYVDFAPPPDDKPFYFNDAMESAQGGTFSDRPGRSANGVRWDATLSLVGVRRRSLTRLDSLDYGFDIDAAGTLNLHQPRTAGVSDIVVQGDTLRSEYPNWIFSGGFAVPQVPGGNVTAGGSAMT
jgi:hypothetical protein